MNWQNLNITIKGLRQHYQQGDFTPAQLVGHLLETMDKYELEQDNPVWITRLTLEQIQPFVDALQSATPEQLPLYGVPFAIKDNIDLAGIPTTASCKEFAYTPESSAFVVEALIRAGGIPLGKTNLDQFATGLVGVRSPYGACKNTLNSKFISGGSSSGSAVAVALQWASFSLGTNTAGSGRVPASLNNIVGLKPSKGLLSTRGVVPACRSLDCVSIFANNTDDANSVFDIAAQFDPLDAYARSNTYSNGQRYYAEQSGALKLGVPAKNQLEFFGDAEAEVLFDESIERLKASGAECVEIDFTPFMLAAKLLYEGPWVAERYIATQSLIESNPEALLPVIHSIISKGNAPKAVDGFKANYTLQSYLQLALVELAKVDAIVTPTNAPAYTIDEVERDPVQLNSNLGYYTNFMNLLDCSAVAIPTGFRTSGVGFGVTCFARAFTDKLLLSIAARVQNSFALATGTGLAFSPQGQSLKSSPQKFTEVVVCGAHLSGLPLNWQLKERGGSLVQVTTTASCYELFALEGGPPKRPGLARMHQGVAIDVEVWRLPIEEFGSFVAEIPQPLGIGKVELANGDWVCGFICEGEGLTDAANISHFGGWRKYLQAHQSHC